MGKILQNDEGNRRKRRDFGVACATTFASLPGIRAVLPSPFQKECGQEPSKCWTSVERWNGVVQYEHLEQFRELANKDAVRF